jgi:NTP pyrophosphatase (non-canonical NTP hydrolase)
MSIKQFKDPRDELLVILMEECAELIQECSKCIRKGEYDRKKFQDELGDVMTMINLAHEWDMFSWNEVEIREEHKRNKLKIWSRLINETESGRVF